MIILLVINQVLQVIFRGVTVPTSQWGCLEMQLTTENGADEITLWFSVSVAMLCHPDCPWKGPFILRLREGCTSLSGQNPTRRGSYRSFSLSFLLTLYNLLFPNELKSSAFPTRLQCATFHLCAQGTLCFLAARVDGIAPPRR